MRTLIGCTAAWPRIPMMLLFITLSILCAGGIFALATGRKTHVAAAIGAGTALFAGAIGCAAAIHALLAHTPSEFTASWSVPFGSFSLGLDPLAGVFLLPICGLTALAGVYGHGYFRHTTRPMGVLWFLFNLLTASMVVVVTARNAILFLMAWEVMTLASFFLVTFEHEDANVQRAGLTYLVAAHIGTACLLAMFVMLGNEAGSFEFAKMDAGGRVAGVAFVLAVVGFGTKAGFMPLHVWLPEAHPAAPSPVSAVMSGVMIKTGIYGLLRVLGMLGGPEPWQGWLLIGVGGVSGVLGVLFALAQHDIKRLLAYHSVENIGIITLGIGLGLLGRALEMPALSALAFAGALLHVVNHAVFKGLLFMGAGAVAHATGTREIDLLGGLLPRMRWTGLCFVVGAAAIAGLPPLNGFVSEFLVYLGALKGIGGAVPEMTAGLTVVVSLALIGGLAAACFAKAVGVVFLGSPRSAQAAQAHECPASMIAPMLVLAALCVAIGVGAPWAVRLLAPAVAQVSGTDETTMASAATPLRWIAAGACGIYMLVALVALARRWLLAGKRVGHEVTWDCGYAAPTARMQYTASSFAQPFTELFAAVLRTVRDVALPKGLFPADAHLHTNTPDLFRARLFVPIARGAYALMKQLRVLQHGRLQLYILYIVITVVALVVWKLM